jgi:transcription elongation factor GreA
MSESPQTTWLTQEAYDRLAAELDERQTARRTEITKRIAAAREEGDLRENGGYHAAKDEQGKNEARSASCGTCSSTPRSARRRPRRARRRTG